MNSFPQRIWELGDVINDKQCWYSRERTRDDLFKRADLMENFNMRQLQRKENE